ncbi:MAG: hypothetical protein AAGH68_11875 [Pseudomonadota bacterium]
MENLVRITGNIDLPDDVFAAIAIRNDPLDLQGTATLGDGLHALVPEIAEKPVEVVGFFERRCHVQANTAGPALEAIETMFATLAEAGLADRVQQVTLVDCGDAYTSPLTDLSLLGQYVETIQGLFRNGIEVRILTADYNLDDEGGTPFVLRDTRSEGFIRHVADYTREAMRMLNTCLGQNELPQFEKTSREQVDARIASMAPVG